MYSIKIKAVLNKCNGGFSLSEQAKEMYIKRKGIKLQKYTWNRIDGKEIYKTFKDGDENKPYFYSYILNEDQINSTNKLNVFNFDDIDRTDADLIYVVETLKEKANTQYSDLSVETINVFINDYDGYEQVTGAE